MLSWIQTNYKNIALILAGLILFMYVREKSQVKIIDTQDINKLAPVSKIIDNKGDEHYGYKEEVVEQIALQKKYDSLLKLYKIKPKTVTLTVTRVDTVFKAITTITDSTRILSYKDGDISIIATDYLKYKERSNIQFVLSPDTLTRITGYKRKFFRPDELKVFDHHSNQLFKETYAASSTIKIPKSLIILTPYLGYDIVNRRFGAGVAIIAPDLSLRIR